MVTRILMGIAFVCAMSPLTAQTDPPQTESTTSKPDSAKGYLKTFLADEYRIWTSPFRPSNYDSHGMRKYGIPFLAISAGLIASDRKTAELLPNTVDQKAWSGRVSQLGAAYTLAGVSAGTLLLGKVIDNAHLTETGSLALQAVAHTQVVVQVLKLATRRERPVLDDARGGFWRGGNSFPSGHAASSFAIASVFAYEYRDHLWVPIGAYSLAAAVSASRLSARRHWASDIFVGGATGFLIGRFVYKRHHDPSLPGSVVQRRSRLIPDFGMGAGGPTVSWSF